ncbi:hypothetical protein [Frondihabitans australicus]|uniref:Uncharacterized protein n=1 Tax=Frondihabitans australicus TaxID=386892 RepID=A0A495IJ48_9MICO|nr:hypothetical protein [Frondihabitans australicus]RKR75799.1 hypothetical protein C8E83_2955 [Frondihabitans australicus]
MPASDEGSQEPVASPGVPGATSAQKRVRAPWTIWAASLCLLGSAVAETFHVRWIGDHSGKDVPFGIVFWVFLPVVLAVFVALGRRWARWVVLALVALVILGSVTHLGDHVKSDAAGSAAGWLLLAALVLLWLRPSRAFLRMRRSS